MLLSGGSNNLIITKFDARVAQSAEQLSCKQQVAGSIPVSGSFCSATLGLWGTGPWENPDYVCPMPATTPPSAQVADEPAAYAVGAAKHYGSGASEVRALDDVDVAFASSEFTAIMGPSGSGKSTLMHCMAGLDTLTSGQVFIDGEELTAMTDRQRTELRREKLGFVFQAFNLVPMLNARANIVLPQRLAGQDPDEEWLEEVVSTVGLGHRLDHRPSELSGGQQQRVAVSRALASKPKLVFADEPTGNLDSTTSNEILTFMRQAVDDLGQTIVMVTHDPKAASYADRVVFLVDGKIANEMRDPTSDAVLDHMKTLGN